MKLLAIFAAAGMLLAQGPAVSVQVTAPSFRLIAGERMTLKALARDAAGVDRPNDPIQWSVDNANVATVEPNGDLTGKTLGIVRVTARISGVTNNIQIQVLPKRVVVEPANAELTVGQSMQFRVTAIDAFDRPLTWAPTTTNTVGFRWFTSSGNGFTTNTSSLNANGMLSTSAVGNVLVRASYDYNTGVPGFERQAQAVATVAIRPPKAYELKKLLSTAAMRGPFRLRARIVPLLANDRGQLVFNASLEGIANGLMMIDGGDRRLLNYGGMAGPLPQTSLIENNSYALNNRGEVLALSGVLFSGNVLYKLTKDSATPVFIDNSPLTGGEFLTGSFINRNSLNDSGAFVMRSGYRVGNVATNPLISALIRVPERGFPEEVVNNREPLGGLPAGFSLDNDFGIAGNGTVFFTASVPGTRALFLAGLDQPQKLLAVGSPLLNSTVRSFSGNGFLMNNDGDLAVAVTLQNNEIHLLRYSGTNPGAAPRSLRLRNFGAILTVHQHLGVLFLGDGGRGWGLYRWSDGEPQAIFLQNAASHLLRGKPVTQIDWAAMGASGDVMMMARTQDAEMELVLVRANEEPFTFLKSGDPVDLRAPVSISALLQGSRNGPVHALLGGRGSSVYEVSEAGLKPVILMGERFAGIQLFTGANNGDARKAPNGDIYVSGTGGAGLLRIRGDQRDFVLRPPIPLEEGITGNAPFNIVVNNRGDLLWWAGTNRGDQRLVLTREGKHTAVLANGGNNQPATVIGGKTVTAWGDQWVDETGRIIATLRFADSSFGLFLWENGTWRRLIEPNETQHSGRTILNYFNVRAANDAFYLIANLSGLGNTLIRWQRDRWETVLGVDETIVTGNLANSIGLFDVNRNGDIFAQCNTNFQVMVVKRGNKTHYVHALNEPAPDGELIVRTSEYDIRDDGTVYFLALTASDDYVLYQAKPVN